MGTDWKKTGPKHYGPGLCGFILPPTWLSLVGLLLSMAQFRFTRQHEA